MSHEEPRLWVTQNLACEFGKTSLVSLAKPDSRVPVMNVFVSEKPIREIPSKLKSVSHSSKNN
jgi:hypothetical protein